MGDNPKHYYVDENVLFTRYDIVVGRLVGGRIRPIISSSLAIDDCRALNQIPGFIEGIAASRDEARATIGQAE